MNDYQLINNIFKNFQVDGRSIPVEYIEYIGKEKTYVTYTFIDDEPSLFGDDKEIGSVVRIDIDIFSNKNFLAIEDKVIEIMTNNNFIRSGCSPDMYERDTGLYHKTIEFEKERIK